MINDSIQRKEKNDQFLKSIGIRVNKFLPRIESETEVSLRSPQETAKRAIVLFSIAGIGFGADPKRVTSWLKTEKIWDCVSPRETKLFESEKPDPQMLIDASWRSENLYTLLWALNIIYHLDLPIKECDTGVMVKAMPAADSRCAEFIERATLRSKPEILDQADLILRIHWAVRDAQLNRRDVPGKFVPSIVRERHYALNWLTFYENDWDEITTDT